MHAEEGRSHAAKALASQLSQFIAMTAVSLADEGTLEAEARDAAKRLFDEYARLQHYQRDMMWDPG